VQEVTVGAPGGEFYLIDRVHFRFAKFKVDATPDELRTGLESVYGAGTVQVTGGPGDFAGDKPYVVTFAGSMADQAVYPMEARYNPTAQGGFATVTEVTRGAADGQIVLTASNLGDADVNGEATPLEITDSLPHGLRAVAIEGLAGERYEAGGNRGPVECTLATLTCDFTGTLPPYDNMEIRISVVVEAGATSGAINKAHVAGGQAPSADVARPVALGTPAQFGVESYELSPEEEGGALDTQAGSHPFQLSTTLSVNQTGNATPVALPRDLHVRLPPGLIGNATSFPQCTLAAFLSKHEGSDACASRMAVGTAAVTVNEPHFVGVNTFTIPIFNLEPAVGEPARFGFFIPLNLTAVVLDTAVRTGGDYGVTVTVGNIPETASLLASQVTFWGVPGDPRHDNARGWGCLAVARGLAGRCDPLEEAHPPPLLTLPASCTGPLQSSVEADSWQQPGDFQSLAPIEPLPAMDGCNRLAFNPTISLATEGAAASSPTGMTVGVHVPQDASLAPTGLAEANVKDTTVALPAGIQLSPAAADGLLACSLGQVSLESAGESSCPDESKVATVEINTPLLTHPLTGYLYLAAQNANPFGSLVALYLVAEDPLSGVRVKLAGNVALNPQTGQITSTFENTPQLPFEDLKVRLFGGSRAPITTPAGCGSYTTNASFTPWSGNASVSSSSSFQINSGPNGRPCADHMPFSPSLAAGSTNLEAGAYTPFTVTMSREDGDQDLGGITMHMPEGVLGMVSSVTPCPEPQASQGTCGPESLIGHAVVSAGLGPDPYTITGQVFITGPYKGAPYGLSVVVPAKAGPFDLGEEVVRAAIYVDPHTSALTVVSDPLPHMKDGIPFQLKHVNVTIDRPGFTFNPTNCSQLQIAATLSSVEGTTAPASVPFEVANCATLPFKPRFTVVAGARTSKAGGASLHVRVTSGPGQANIAKVRVVLPKQLPSRLSTLHQACQESVFNANPASCPAGSVVGTAKAVTPVLRSPLTGPAYLVSHADEAFPGLVIVLQGEGITLSLDGTTDIKRGITSSTFNAVPDAPIKSFDLTLPAGPHSALAAYLPPKSRGSMCGQTLTMPTVIAAQNGAVIRQTTKIAVSGCTRHKKAKKARNGVKRASGKRRRR
jgi:hypothetical protein